MWNYFAFFFFFEVKSHSLALVSLELAMKTRLALLELTDLPISASKHWDKKVCATTPS